MNRKVTIQWMLNHSRAERQSRTMLPMTYQPLHTYLVSDRQRALRVRTNRRFGRI